MKVIEQVDCELVEIYLKKTAEKICQLLNYLFKDKHVVGIHKYYLDDCQISKSLHH